jgi:hypothetical protein
MEGAASRRDCRGVRACGRRQRTPGRCEVTPCHIREHALPIGQQAEVLNSRSSVYYLPRPVSWLRSDRFRLDPLFEWNEQYGGKFLAGNIEHNVGNDKHLSQFHCGPTALAETPQCPRNRVAVGRGPAARPAPAIGVLSLQVQKTARAGGLFLGVPRRLACGRTNLNAASSTPSVHGLCPG